MDRRSVLSEVMQECGASQSELSRLSGVSQPSISQFLSGRTPMSDDMLDRLLCCLGYRLEVVRRPVKPRLTRSEDRSWRLHRELSRTLDASTFPQWRPVMERNLRRVRANTTGQPHQHNLDRWEDLLHDADLLGLHRVLTGLDRASIEMREVSPLGGLLPQHERSRILGRAS